MALLEVMLSVSQDTIIYGQDYSANEKAINNALGVDMTKLSEHKKRIVYVGTKAEYAIVVANGYYIVDVPNLNVEGLVAWFGMLSRVRNSALASGANTGLLVLYGVERASAPILNGILQLLGPQLSTDVRLYVWIVTSSLSCLARAFLDDCHFVGVPSMRAGTSWQKKSARIIAEKLIREITKGNNASIMTLRSHLYSLFTLTLSIDDLAWPLLKLFVNEVVSRGFQISCAELLPVVSHMIKCCNDSSRGHRAILHLERMVIYLAIVFDELAGSV